MTARFITQSCHAFISLHRFGLCPMTPRWRLDRPDWRAADRALLSGVVIYGAIWVAAWLCDSLAGADLVPEGTLFLDIVPYCLLFFLTIKAARQSDMGSIQQALALRPLRLNRETAAFIVSTLAVFYVFVLVMATLATHATETTPTVREPSAIYVVIGVLIGNLFLSGYLFTRIEVHAGSLYALAVTGVFAGATSYGYGFAGVVQGTLFGLFIGWARARSGTVVLPILMSMLMSFLPSLLSWLVS